MAWNMSGATVDESKYDGIHTIIIHLQLPQPNGAAMPSVPISGANGVEEPYEEPLTHRKAAPALEEDVIAHVDDPISRHREPITPPAEPAIDDYTRTAVYKPDDQPPPSRFETKCHPRADEVCAELDNFFATYWPWANEQARQKFLASDTNRWACWALPLVRDDRIVNSVKVNTLLFLLDDVAENMSVEDGKAFYERLIILAKGKDLPIRENPYEWITYDTFASMRAVDEAQTEAVLQDAILCVTAQVDEARNHCVGMGALLKQRYKEGGVRFVASVVRYGMDLKVTEAALEDIKDIEISYSRIGIIVNDIHSLEKELRAYSRVKTDCAKVLNMVQMQALETGISYAAAKRVLWVLDREWELQHLDMVSAREKQLDLEGQEGEGEKYQDLRIYLKGLEYVLSGNEKWSEYTERYHEQD